MYIPTLMPLALATVTVPAAAVHVPVVEMRSSVESMMILV
jgi:hypothetical protein